MTPKMRSGWARLPLLVAGMALASMMAAAAQTPPAGDEPEEMQEAEEIEAVPAADEVDIMKDIDVSKLDWSQLDVDVSTLGDFVARRGSSSNGAGGAEMSWTANDRANGTSAVA